MTSIAEITCTYFDTSSHTELRPADGFAASPAFDPGTDVSRRLRGAYEATMPELYFGAAPAGLGRDLHDCPFWLDTAPLRDLGCHHGEMSGTMGRRVVAARRHEYRRACG